MRDMVTSTCRDLDLWPFDVISVSQVQVHTWFNFGEISSNIYEDIVFARFFGSLPAVTLTYDPLIPKSNQHIHETNTSVTKIDRNSLHCFFEIWCLQGFRVIACCDHDLWPFRPRKLISTSIDPSTSVTKIGWNSLHWFLRYGVHNVFETHRLTHSLTDGQTRMEHASGTVFQR